MCSRSPLHLLLLCALAFVEVSSWPTPRLPLIEDNIDLSKCVATREGNNQYKCFIKKWGVFSHTTECIQSAQYVQEKKTTTRQPPADFNDKDRCSYGCTIRALTKSAWEIEIVFFDPYQNFFFEFFRKSGVPIGLQVSLESKKNLEDPDDFVSENNFIPTVKEIVRDKSKWKDVVEDQKVFHKDHFDPGTERKYNASQFNSINMRQYYMRFRLFRNTGDKTFNDFSYLYVSRRDFSRKLEALEEDDFPVAAVSLSSKNCGIHKCDAKIDLKPCGQMAQMVYRKKYVSGWSQLTKIPREAFHHNVYDFTQMCTHLPRYNQPDQVFYPYHVETGHEIVAIECLPEQESDDSVTATKIPYAILRNVNGTALPYNNFKDKYRDKNKVNYQFVEVTCRSKEDICYYCGEPEWNKDTASIPSDLAPMTFMAGQNGSCATLTCPADSLPYYPHIRFTSLEPPRCEHNAEKDAFEWTFSFQPLTQWNRVRRPLERGYCRKKTNCPPFTESMLECPKQTAHMPWFTGCVPANYTNVVAPRYYCDNSTKQLYFAISRRILQKPAMGILCNSDTGLYEAHLPNGKMETGFTEESWVVCRNKPVHPKFDTYWNIKPDWKLRVLVGSIVGVVIPILLGLCFIGLYFPIAKYVRVQAESTLQPEQVHKKEVEKKKVSTTDEKEEETTRKRKEYGEEDDPRKKNVDDDYAKVLEARQEMAKRMIEKYVVMDHNNDEKTCRVPTKSEQEKLEEMERIAECTTESDQTGRDVKPIAREEEPEREVRLPRH